MKILYKSFFTLLFFVVLLRAVATDISVDKYGAVGDGKTINTSAIQKAIDDCSNSGGGKVFFPTGKWVSGTILLKTGVTLSIDNQATLLGSENIEDYYIVDGFKDGTGQEMGYCFIGAVDVKDVGIEGKGIIDGRGKAVLASGGKNRRPFLIRFVRCNTIKVSDVHLRASAAWTMHIFHCKNVEVEGLTIKSKGLPNNDGIDVDCCENVKINDCDIDSGDDAICFKTTSPFPCENIAVSNIKARTNCAAIKFGTESAGDFRNIRVSAIKVAYAGLGAIKILSVDGSHISNIDISDIDGDSVNVPIMIRLGARLKTFRTEDKKQEAGTINDIKITNVKVKNAKTTGILISGIPNHLINAITLKDISINLDGGGTIAESKIRLDEKIGDYPEVRMFGKVLPAYAMYVRHASNLIFTNISITTKLKDERQALFVCDVENLAFNQWVLPAAASSEPVINLESTRNVSVKGFKTGAIPAVFVNVEGKDSRAISVTSSFVSKESIHLGNGVLPDEITITRN